MSLLLRCHVDEYRIDACRSAREVVRTDRLHAALLEPLADEIAVKPITLDDEHAHHGWPQC